MPRRIKAVRMLADKLANVQVSLQMVALAAAMVAAVSPARRTDAQATLPVNYQELVHTLEAPNDLGQVVVTLVDTTPASLGAATPGTNYLAPIFWNAGAGANEWTKTNLGQVYGVTLDGASNPNIYVTAASRVIYFTAQPNAFGPLGPGGVTRLDGVTGAICPLVALPNHLTQGPGLGNITYSSRTNSLYVSNFEDGLIYRLPLGTNVNAPLCPISLASAVTYDHGVSGRPAMALAPIPDDGVLGNITAYGRRVWGLAVHPTENRLYYGVWWDDDTAPNAIENNEVWSVALNAVGDAIPATAFREFAVPPIPSSGSSSSPVAGLNFTPTGTLLIGERSPVAHQSRLLEYTGATHAWLGQPTNKYLVGLGGTSCSGVGNMDCDGNVWSAGDGIVYATANFVYGLIRIPSGGNASHVPSYGSSILIDSDQEIINQDDKTQIGSLVFRSPCGACATFSHESIQCVPGSPGSPSTYTWTFRVTNNSPNPMLYLQLPAGDPHFNPHTYVIPTSPLGAPLAPGATSDPMTITITGAPVGEFCFDVTFATPSFDPCCRNNKCLTMPECDCLQFPTFDLSCVSGIPGSFTLTFKVQNLTAGPVNQFYIIPPFPSTITALPDSFLLVPDLIPGATSGALVTTITGAVPGSRLCLKFTFNHDCDTCCDADVCFTVPLPCPPGTGVAPCTPGALCYADCDGNGLVNVNDFTCFMNHFAAGDPCANCDSSTTAPPLNVNDFTCFLNRFAAGCP